MRKTALQVRISSKGQIVLPARVRRELGWGTGRVLQVKLRRQGGVILTAEHMDWEAIEEARRRFQDWFDATGVDPVEELHERRRREREALRR